MEKTKGRVGSKLAKVVRVITVAPIMALAAVLLLYIHMPAEMGGVAGLVVSILFLCVLPVTAYPLQPVVPGFKDKGREGQRNLAMIMSVLGYVGGTIYVLVSNAPRMLTVVFLTYIFSGIGVVLFNKLVKARASGHACGVAGPVAMLVLAFGPLAGVLGALLLALVYWASLRMGRHTLPQLLYGTLIPLVCFGLSWLLTANM